MSPPPPTPPPPLPPCASVSWDGGIDGAPSARSVCCASRPCWFTALRFPFPQATLDRFAGYPDHPGYVNDGQVPFFDMATKTNKYPLSAGAVPLDWEFTGNVDATNHAEHVGDRWSWYGGGVGKTNPKLSTATASYRMQGQCDPNATVTDKTYVWCVLGVLQPLLTHHIHSIFGSFPHQSTVPLAPYPTTSTVSLAPYPTTSPYLHFCVCIATILTAPLQTTTSQPVVQSIRQQPTNRL